MTNAVEAITSVQRRRCWVLVAGGRLNRFSARASLAAVVGEQRHRDPVCEPGGGMACGRLYRHCLGFDGLALMVRETVKSDPRTGYSFVFRARRGGLIMAEDLQQTNLFSFFI